MKTPRTSESIRKWRGRWLLALAAMALVLTPRTAVAQRGGGDEHDEDSNTTVPAPLALEIEWPGDTHDLDAANDELGDIIREALESGASDLVRPRVLPDLYYHEDRYRITVATERAAAAARGAWEVVAAEAFLEQQHAALELRLPRLHVAGRYALDRRAHGDFDAREEGVFRLELCNVSASGLLELRAAGAGGRLELGRVLLAPRAQETFFQHSRELFHPDMRLYAEGGALEAGLRRRVWRELTRQLEEAVRARLRPALARCRLRDLLPNAQDRRALRAYEEQATESADAFVDILLDAARAVLAKDKDGDRVPIPDLREGFERKVLLLTVRGGFEATEGSARGLASARRSGDAFFAHHPNGSGFSLWGGLAFDDLSVSYAHYEAHVLGVGPSGSLSAEVFPLALHVHVRLDFDADRAFLEEFRIDDAGEMQVEVTGMGAVLNWLASLVATWLLGAYRDRVVEELQLRYANFLAATLQRLSLDRLVNDNLF